MTWRNFEEGDPELAAFGAERFGGEVAYFATVRKDGSPRVHPVTPIIGGGRLFLFMEPTSPKTCDLERDSRFAMHSAVDDSGGSNGEFFVFGKARFINDAAERESATEFSSFEPEDRYVLFELQVESAFSTVYDGDLPVRHRWKSG